MTFIARTRTRANTPTSPALNLFPVKLHGLNRLFIAHLKFVAPKRLLDNQIDILKSFMSWNGYPIGIRNFLINKLKLKYKSSSSTTIAASDADLPKVWVRLPYLGKRGESLVKSCVSKIRRYLQNPIKVDQRSSSSILRKWMNECSMNESMNAQWLERLTGYQKVAGSIPV